VSPLRPRPLPPPGAPGELALDVLLREYPELLAPLRSAGVDPAEVGAVPLRGAVPDEVLEDILRLVAERTAWRER